MAEKIKVFIVCSVIAVPILYVIARVVTRAVMRSIQEWKERNKNG